MMRGKLLFTLLTVAATGWNGFAQVPGVAFSRTFGGNMGERGYSVRPDSDGGFILSGYTFSSPGTGDVADRISGKEPDIWVVKTDSEGVLVWEDVYGTNHGAHSESPTLIAPVADGGYILTGSVRTDAKHIQIYVAKLDKEGGVEWDRDLGGDDQDESVTIQQTRDGGYIVLGKLSTNADGMSGKGDEFYLVKLDKDGNTEWEKEYGSTDSDAPRTVLQTSDGGYLIGGHASKDDGDVTPGNFQTPHLSSADAWVIKTDDKGNKQWDRTYGGNNWDYFAGFAEAADGNYAAVLFTRSVNGDVPARSYVDPYESDIWVVKLDKDNGDILWSRICPSKAHETPYYIQATRDGGFLVVGETDADADGEGFAGIGERGIDGLVLKLDGEGNIEWYRACGGTAQDLMKSGLMLDDGSIILAGTSGSTDHDVPAHALGGDKLWILKLEAPAISGLSVTTQGGVPALITDKSGTLQLHAQILPGTLLQDVTWSLTPVTGEAVIDADGLVTASADGIVRAVAVAVADPQFRDSIEITISGQADPEPGNVHALGAAVHSWSVYPNPADRELNISFGHGHSALEISVTDLQGRKIHTAEKPATGGPVVWKLPLQGISQGMYMLHIRQEGTVSTQSFIVK